MGESKASEREKVAEVNSSYMIRSRQVSVCDGRELSDNAGGDRRLRVWAGEDGFIRGRALCTTRTDRTVKHQDREE